MNSLCWKLKSWLGALDFFELTLSASWKLNLYCRQFFVWLSKIFGMTTTQLEIDQKSCIIFFIFAIA